MKKNIFTLLAIIMIMTSCNQSQTNVVKIGVIGPITGAGATTSAYWTNGLMYAVENMNATNEGEQYKLLIEDCQSDPAIAVSCFKRLESQGVKYFLAVGGQFAMAVAPLTKDKDILFFTTADYNTDILNQTNRGFRIFPSSTTFADTAVNYMKRTYNFNNYATFALNTVACLEATKSFTQGVKRVGGQIVFQETYNMGSFDFNNVVAKYANNGTEGIFMTGFGISPLAFANQLATNSSFDNVVLFGDLNVATKSFVDGLRNNNARIVYADCRFPETMEIDYYKKYGSHSNAIVTSSYIIPYMIQEARSKTKPNDIKAQMNYMREHTFETQLGDISIDSNGDCKMGVQVYHLQ